LLPDRNHIVMFCVRPPVNIASLRLCRFFSMLIVFVICNNSNQDCAVSRTWVLVTVFTWSCSYHIKHALFVMLLLRIVHCLSVCPSCLYILSKRPNISSHFFHPPSGSTSSSFCRQNITAKFWRDPFQMTLSDSLDWNWKYVWNVTSLTCTVPPHMDAPVTMYWPSFHRLS